MIIVPSFFRLTISHITYSTALCWDIAAHFWGILCLFPRHFRLPFTSVHVVPSLLATPGGERVGRLGGRVFLVFTYVRKTHSAFGFRRLHIEPCPGSPAGSCWLGKRRECLSGNIVNRAVLVSKFIFCMFATLPPDVCLDIPRNTCWGFTSPR